MGRLLPFAALYLVLASAFTALWEADVTRAASSAGCRTVEARIHDEAVFGHLSGRTAADLLARRAERVGFRGIKIEDDGCGDYEVEIDGAPKASRASFTAEAARAGFQVTFEQLAPPLRYQPGQVIGVFAQMRSLAAANTLVQRLASRGFRYLDIAFTQGRWLVVMPEVPVNAAGSISAEVRKAGFRIVFRTGAH